MPASTEPARRGPRRLLASALRKEFVYEVGSGAGSCPVTAPALLLRKSMTEATATQSIQKSIVKKSTETIAATLAAKPNQLT
jgi:hypothetical protein